MKSVLKILTLCSVIIIFSFCVDHINGNIILRTQQQVNEFEHKKIDGDLEIRGIDITSLNGLSSLTSVNGDLIVESTKLTSLSELDNVNYVSGDLIIDNNDNLTSLSGLDNITSVSGDLIISGNDNLVDFCAITSLAASGEYGEDGDYGDYSVKSNGYNPTYNQVQLASSCSM